MAKKGEFGKKKATRQEACDRLDMACTLLCKPLDKGEVKRAMAKLYNISTKMAEVYIGRARDTLREETGRSKSEHRTDAYSVLKGVIASGVEKTIDRLKAQEQMSKLLGLNNPDTLAITDSQGNDIASDEERTLFTEVLGIASRRRTTEATPSGNGSNGSADAAGAAS